MCIRDSIGLIGALVVWNFFHDTPESEGLLPVNQPKQKTAYEMESRDWSSDVCSSDLNFDTIEAAKVVEANEKLYINREEGFIGTALKKDE